jgi:hypothetical protein
MKFFYAPLQGMNTPEEEHPTDQEPPAHHHLSINQRRRRARRSGRDGDSPRPQQELRYRHVHELQRSSDCSHAKSRRVGSDKKDVMLGHALTLGMVVRAVLFFSVKESLTTILQLRYSYGIKLLSRADTIYQPEGNAEECTLLENNTRRV